MRFKKSCVFNSERFLLKKKKEKKSLSSVYSYLILMKYLWQEFNYSIIYLFWYYLFGFWLFSLSESFSFVFFIFNVNVRISQSQTTYSAFVLTFNKLNFAILPFSTNFLLNRNKFCYFFSLPLLCLLHSYVLPYFRALVGYCLFTLAKQLEPLLLCMMMLMLWLVWQF